MENNHDIDKKFNEASQSLKEPATFPGFDQVWGKVEEKLDRKKGKKRMVPVWFPYGIAASLMIGLGAFYFINKKDVLEIQKPEIVQNTVSPAIHSNVQRIDSTVKYNIEREIDAQEEIQNPEILAYEHVKINEKTKISDLNFKRTTQPNIKETPDITNAKDSMKTQDISEVVITGALGIKKKVDITSSSSVLIASTDKSAPKTSLAEMSLSGRVAGVAISSDSKKSDAIHIRGARSLDSGVSSALFVVDGIISGQSSNVLRILDSKKIKNVKVIKGVEATAMYGSQGKNGVVFITTKGLTDVEKKKIKEHSTKKNDEPINEEKELQKAGLLTAGEVNDFSKWNYWKDIALPTLDEYKQTWKFFPDRRVSVQLVNRDKRPVIGEKVKLLNDKKEVIWEAVSDNLGNVELWIDPFDSKEKQVSEKYYLSDGFGQIISTNIQDFRDRQNLIVLNKPCLIKRTLDLAFVVDATGSMGDEISYLQSELLDVLKKVESNLKHTDVRYGSVFYRDMGDEYVTRKFDFSDNAEDLIGFIKKQHANGGGDTPEAVVEAMQVSINELNWSPQNSTKIMFLILDAPPHQSEENINLLFDKIKTAAKKGITIIPLAASDIDKQTEYLMRTFALLTNGTYTFLTNDSGIGNDHIKPTIDSYEVEKLNDLLLRLILQRATLPECNVGISNDYINKKLETEINNQTDSKTTVFPNPTKGRVHIKTNKTINELFVYDLAGKIIMRKENLKENKSFDITAYPQSIYLLRLRFGDQWETFKIIKN